MTTTPFNVFKMCQNALGRKYNGTVQDFESLPAYNYYVGLSLYLREYLGKRKYKHIRFINVCAKELGARFDPFQLKSEEYKKVYEEWESINGSPEKYKRNVLDSIQFIYDFCKTKNIKELDKYRNTWSVTHLISGKMNENVAFMLGVQKNTYTKPETKLLKQKYLNHLDDIEERLKEDKELREIIETQLEIVQKRLREIVK